jgi:hypothetical protein
VLARVVDSYDAAEAGAAASPATCDLDAEATAFQAFADARYAYIVHADADELVHW